ncbi:MAG: hypothetical protein HRT36_05825 [Alphaproteobacteria bacterium]|nr:hypothetical protein [Alphaproteobacteria bacterium]
MAWPTLVRIQPPPPRILVGCMVKTRCTDFKICGCGVAKTIKLKH